jgi:hypothetical protein
MGTLASAFRRCSAGCIELTRHKTNQQALSAGLKALLILNAPRTRKESSPTFTIPHLGDYTFSPIDDDPSEAKEPYADLGYSGE